MIDYRWLRGADLEIVGRIASAVGRGFDVELPRSVLLRELEDLYRADVVRVPERRRAWRAFVRWLRRRAPTHARLLAAAANRVDREPREPDLPLIRIWPGGNIVLAAPRETHIDGDDFAAALRDPKVRDLHDEAVEQHERLRRDGRDHTEPAFRVERYGATYSLDENGWTRTEPEHDGWPFSRWPREEPEL